MFRDAVRSARNAALRGAAKAAIAVGALEVTTKLPSQGRSSEFYHRLCDEVATPALRKFAGPEGAFAFAPLLRCFALLCSCLALLRCDVVRRCCVGATLCHCYCAFGPARLSAATSWQRGAKDSVNLELLLSSPQFSFSLLFQQCISNGKLNNHWQRTNERTNDARGQWLTRPRST